MSKASRRHPKAGLGNSWVVEGDIDSNTSDQEYEDSPRRSPRDKHQADSPSSRRIPAEPEFRMPVLNYGDLDGSWVNAEDDRKNRKGVPRRRTVQDRVSNTSPSTAGSPRSRKIPTTKQTRSSETSEGTLGSFQASQEMLLGYAGGMLSWTTDVIAKALWTIKTPISFILAIYLLFGIGLVLRNLITTSIYSSLSPLCRLPGSSLLHLPFCAENPHVRTDGSKPLVEFDKIVTVQSNFEDVLEASAGTAALPLDMKRSEASIRDLRQLVRYSNLQSRQEIVLEFDGFIETARTASYDLQRFNSHVGRAVDSVLATTRWTTRVLDSISDKDSSRGSLQAFFTDKVLAPFQPSRPFEDAILDQYILHTRLVEGEINRLIGEAQSLLMVLTNLEDRLDIIHGIVVRDDAQVKATKEDLMTNLWTLLGGNRGKLKRTDRQLQLLKDIGGYRKLAFAHISGTILKLQEMSTGLEDLRERVAAPEVLRDMTEIPLSVHIENIRMGVERLEAGRQNAKILENDHLKRVSEKSQAQMDLIDAF